MRSCGFCRLTLTLRRTIICDTLSDLRTFLDDKYEKIFWAVRLSKEEDSRPHYSMHSALYPTKQGKGANINGTEIVKLYIERAP